MIWLIELLMNRTLPSALPQVHPVGVQAPGHGRGHDGPALGAAHAERGGLGGAVAAGTVLELVAAVRSSTADQVVGGRVVRAARPGVHDAPAGEPGGPDAAGVDGRQPGPQFGHQ